MTDLRMLCFSLGIEVHQCKSKVAYLKKLYAAHILESFKMVDCNPTNTPIEAQL